MSDWVWALAALVGILFIYVTFLRNQNDELRRQLDYQEQQLYELQEQLNCVRSFNFGGGDGFLTSVIFWGAVIAITWVALGGQIPGVTR